MRISQLLAVFGRLMVVANSRSVDKSEAIGTYEFTVNPQAFFAPCGSVLPCRDKASLATKLRSLLLTPAIDAPVQNGQFDEHAPTGNQGQNPPR